MKELYEMPAPVISALTGRRRRKEISYPVSYRYNGGVIIDGELYAGYKVPPPIVPAGHTLTNRQCGLQLNAEPPHAMSTLTKNRD